MAWLERATVEVVETLRADPDACDLTLDDDGARFVSRWPWATARWWRHCVIRAREGGATRTDPLYTAVLIDMGSVRQSDPHDPDSAYVSVDTVVILNAEDEPIGEVESDDGQSYREAMDAAGWEVIDGGGDLRDGARWVVSRKRDQ